MEFLNRPNWKEMARDVVSIADSIIETSHPNGIACEWGGAMTRLGLLYVQQAMPVDYYDNFPKQDEIRLSGLTMGGTGHGSKLNTRIIYVPVAKRDDCDHPLSDDMF